VGNGSSLLTVAGGTLTLTACRIEDVTEWAVTANGGTVTLSDVSFARVRGGVNGKTRPSR